MPPLHESIHRSRLAELAADCQELVRELSSRAGVEGRVFGGHARGVGIPGQRFTPGAIELDLGLELPHGRLVGSSFPNKSATPVDSAMSESTHNASILVVDDTVVNLRLLSSLLGEQGYDVRPVTSGRLALQAARHDPPELILLDITMPEMSGFETCERLKESEELKDIPVIFLTALSETADKVKAFNVGGADYITKPFQIEEVLARVRVHLALRRAQVELKKNYERLRSLEQLRDDLVHMVVHDMRSPLTVLKAHLYFLEKGPDALDSEAAEDVRAAARAAGVITRMANDLLDVSRLEDGKLPLDPRPHDLVGIAAKIRSDLAAWDPSRAIDLEAADPVEVTCDGGIVHRVLENLVNNALKYTPDGSRILISIKALEGRARIAVLDEGPGVPDHAKQTIFEKFGTVNARRDKTHHSAGLGLAFCKLAVDAHGGAIGVDDRMPNGSVFWFDLPA
jgi:two-component system sensor histidine kinase/response regulator